MGARNAWKVFVYTLFLLYTTKSERCTNEKRCQVMRTRGMRGADCFHLDLEAVPKCLPSNIEILYLAYNRIRSINKSDFENYPYLKHLYLSENFIKTPKEDVFEALQSLETLDIAFTALEMIPAAVFKLPNLKTLYIGRNSINISDTIERAKPIECPLTQLDMSYLFESEGDWIEFPDFGELPYLAKLNITSNRFTVLKPKHFAGLCNLQILTTVNVSANFENGCDCWVINHWLKERNVDFEPFECDVSEAGCTGMGLTEDELAIYKSCRGKFESYQTANKIKKVAIGVGVSLGILLLILAVVTYKILSRRKKRKTTSIKKELEIKKNDVESNAHLLNNQNYNSNL